MGMTERILKIDPYDFNFEEVREDDKWAFADEKFFHELLAERSVSPTFGGVGTFTVTGEELNRILGTNEFKEYDSFLIIWDN